MGTQDGVRLAHSEQLDQLGVALSAAQAQIVGAVKDSTNPFFKSTYADLASVWSAARKPLTDHGLSVIQLPVSEDGHIGLTTMLLHSSGQYVTSTMFALSKDASPQAVGSVVTYLRRYALSACVGIPQVDDDAEAGEVRTASAVTPARRAVVSAPPPVAPVSSEPDYSNDANEDISATKDELHAFGVFVKEMKTAKGKTWEARFIVFSDGREGAIFLNEKTAPMVELLNESHTTGKRLGVTFERSKKDPTKFTIVACGWDDDIIF